MGKLQPSLGPARRRLILLLASAVLWAGPVRALRAQSTGPQYVVAQGDTLFDIALSFGLSVEELQAANPGLDPANLSVGLSLEIPGFEGVSGHLVTHALETGESFDSLAQRFGLARDTLIRLNHVVNAGLLYVGQPIVLVDQTDAGPALPTGVTYLAQSGEGLLPISAGHNQSPWAVAAANRLPNPGRLAPHTPFLLPGGEQPTLGLPFPLTSLGLGPFPPVQGHTLSIQIASARPVSLTGTLGDSELHFNAADDSGALQVALQGIYRIADPSLYPLTLRAIDDEGEAVEYSQSIPVRAGEYLIDRPLTVDPATIDPVVSGTETDQIRAIVLPVTSPRQWDGLFGLPSVGAMQSLFGSLRSYNGGPYDSFHGGVDFSGGEDRPITAPAAGTVVFTGLLTVRGNATLLDHGWGVYTGFWHQSQIVVQVGAHVQAGQVIGYNGATGRATGRHLHWEVWVGGYQVDPLQWTEVTFP